MITMLDVDSKMKDGKANMLLERENMAQYVYRENRLIQEYASEKNAPNLTNDLTITY